MDQVQVSNNLTIIIENQHQQKGNDQCLNDTNTVDGQMSEPITC